MTQLPAMQRAHGLRRALNLIRAHFTPGTRRGYVERRLRSEIAELEQSLTRPCFDCGGAIELTADEAAGFAQRGQLFPVRCRSCALARRQRARHRSH